MSPGDFALYFNEDGTESVGVVREDGILCPATAREVLESLHILTQLYGATLFPPPPPEATGIPAGKLAILKGKAPERDPLEYSLSRMEAAARSDNPAAHGYGQARMELLDGIRHLRKLAVLGEIRRRRADNLLTALGSIERTAREVQRAWRTDE